MMTKEITQYKKFFHLFIFVHILFFIYGFFVEAPGGFEANTTITIETDVTASEVANVLLENNLIRSKGVTLGLFYLTGATDEIKSGEYLFSKRESIYDIRERLVSGTYNIPFVRVTVQEGLHNRDIAKAINKKLPHISEEAFLSLTKNLEGKLHPDTYKFHYNENVEKVVDTMVARQQEILEELSGYINNEKFTIDEILTIASIVEREASNNTDRRYIAGILLNRLRKDIPLQVDVSFYYINGKNTFNLSTSDLREDHPYNTYTRKGLPPTPIGAPSRSSILAVLNPIASDFIYFLADKTGKTHYSVTYEEHLEKKRKYINN